MLLPLSLQRKPAILLLLALIFLFVCFGLLASTPSTEFFSVNRLNNNHQEQHSLQPTSSLDSRLVEPWHNSTRVKAAFVILTRNSELDAIRKTMQQLEARFNRKFNYPYVFLNDEEFTEEFIELTSGMTSAETHYGIT